MDSPSSSATRVTARSSMMDSFRGCSLIGPPERAAFRAAETLSLFPPTAMAKNRRPEMPMVVFINPRSGGRHGPMLKERLQLLMGEEQTLWVVLIGNILLFRFFDLSDVKPHEFVEYGLGCLERLENLVTSVPKSVVKRSGLWWQGVMVQSVGSFGWGGSFPFAWKSAIKKTLFRATTGPICRLDSLADECTLDEGLEIQGLLPEKRTCYEGVFYNYFSIGMDAQVAYGFHHLRNEKPFLAQGPISNKLVYSGYSCTQGWFFTPCTSDPSLRGLKNILRIHVKKVNCSEWEQIPVPSSVRAIVALNLHNYGSGRNPWGNLKPEYLEKKGFVEAHADDGLLEIFGLKQGWHASFVMVELISAKHIAQAAAIRLEVRGGEWRNAYMQMDGEPWKQPMDEEFSTLVEIKRVPFQSPMISGD
ncbi:hypothetical protein M0R45_019191 [Rubus argutus]|uniref:Diacylglycerol kinase accessory domain-containing protein n=1 Tax=Rubus argutus TaxID=59490 RepID=A0AAW1X883_RUBAR